MCFSVLILTRDEETNLKDCLKSVSWSDDLVVFDSYSTDRTVEIAKAAGARVIQRQFDNYASQRNAALNEVKYKNPWVLMVDADEVVTDELANELNSVVESCSDEMCLYRVRRKDYFTGRWLKHSTGYPTWFGRLARIGRVKVTRAINEEYHTDGKIGFLREHLLHYPFNKGVAHWFERHNQYSSMEAERLIAEMQDALKPKDVFSFDPVIRRKALKQLAYHMPERPFLVFFYLYFVRGGFLDGRAGLTYCTLRAIYEHMIDIKVKELRQKNPYQFEY